MRKPTIDELLKNVDNIYELTMLAAKEATRLRIKDRDTPEALQKALERIAEGKVRGQYLTEDEMEEYEHSEREKKETEDALRQKSQMLPPPPTIPALD